VAIMTTGGAVAVDGERMGDCASPKYIPGIRVGVVRTTARGAVAVDGERMGDCTSPKYVPEIRVGVAIRIARGAAAVETGRGWTIVPARNMSPIRGWVWQ
jgi:hypothetical protein